jgi:hypothetical protein
MPAVIEKARQDRADGQLWRARQRLASYVSSTGYDRWVLELLGEICYEMGDFPAAGRYWFFVELRTPPQQEAVALFLQLHRRHPQRIPYLWPAKLRYVRLERLPAEVQNRFRTMAEHLPPPRARVNTTRAAYTSKDLLLFSGCLIIALFGLFCFSVGFAQIMNVR